MDPSLIRRLRRLHVLRASASAPAASAVLRPTSVVQPSRRSMEALARDLSHALDESSSSQSHRRRRGWRRRSRSAGNICSSALSARTFSEDSGSSVGEAHLSTERQLSSVQVSDSDEMVTTAGILSHSRRLQRHRLAATAAGQAAPPESDSVNENFSPARLHRRKRKLKRLVSDNEMSLPSTSMSGAATGGRRVPGSTASLGRKRSKLQDGYDAGRSMAVLGSKRKCGRKQAGSMFPPRCPDNVEDMDGSDIDKRPGDMLSSSSLSSGGESDHLEDVGGYTNDEGREGDDEQSDWYHEPADDTTETEATRRLRIKPNREIRSGRRQLTDRRPPISIISSLNDRISAFLQDPQQTELRIQTPGGKTEEDQLCHLANVYWLRVCRDAPGIYSAFKTGKTTRCVRVDPGCVWAGGDSKRRRRTLPPATSASFGAALASFDVSSSSGELFSVPAPWLTSVPPTIVETSQDGIPTPPVASGSRPTSGDGHTPVPRESSSPQTTEEAPSPMQEAD